MLSLRPAQLTDARFVWECRNDPEARRFSTNTRAIPYATHRRWFMQALKRPNCYLGVATISSGEAVGYVRYEQEGQQATISVGIHPVMRRLGFGPQAIGLGTEGALHGGAQQVVAWICPENAPSRKAFSGAGYHYTETTTQGGIVLERWIATK